MNDNVTIIRPPAKWGFLDVREIWRYRELFYIFAWRDIKVRYKQTVLGILWVIFQPLITMLIFTIFFGNIAKIQSGDLPYSLFVLCGLVYWTFFSGIVSHASDSMIANENVIKKVYFPKIILPVSSAIVSLVDFFINLLFLFIFAHILGFKPSILSMLIIPFGIIITIITGTGLGLLLSAFNVKYRDVRYVLPFFIQLLLFLTPVIYPLAVMSNRNRTIMALNPMSAVVETTRFIFSDNHLIYPYLIIISVGISFLILIIGLWFFNKTEQFFADII